MEKIELVFMSGRVECFEAVAGTYEDLKRQVSQCQFILTLKTKYVEFHIPCWLLMRINKRSK